MFTGIIETTGTIVSVVPSGSNVEFAIRSAISSRLKTDQSVAHDGVCLTVTSVYDDVHKVTAVAETMQKTNLNGWKPGGRVNLERSLRVTSFLDGHIVQGHVDTVAICTDIKEENGSHRFYFEHPEDDYFITVPKGSVCVNGVSLTVVDSRPNGFSVVIIPYTFQNTSFCHLRTGSAVNVEFDIIGKYLKRLIK